VSDLSVKTALGLTLYESGQRERGLGYLEEVARQRPETHGAQFQIGKHYCAGRIRKRASQALEQFFRYRPEEDKRNDWEAQLLLGTAYYLGGNLVESRKLLEKAQESRPRDNQVRQMLGHGADRAAKVGRGCGAVRAAAVGCPASGRRWRSTWRPVTCIWGDGTRRASWR
jgi:tetratricopeptide (TPR) repeat protein